MGNSRILSDKHLWIIIALSIIYAAYWINYGTFLYSNYLSRYYDLGANVYSFYWHLHMPTVIPLQYLVTGNHISPFSLLLLPIFALSQTPTMLLVIQDAALALTAIILYLVCADLIRSRKISLAIAFAFLVSPPLSGLFFFDFHLEAFIPLFVILSFYFYMKCNKIGFFISCLLLLSVMETAPFVAISLIFGLLFYEYIHGSKGRSEGGQRDVKILWAGLALALAFIALYYGIGTYLTASYATIPYSKLPPTLWYNSDLSPSLASYIPNTTGNKFSLPAYVPSVVGLIVIFVGMGLSTFADPLLTLILCSPWLALAFFYPSPLDVSPNFFFQYYSYAIGGIAVAVTLGLLIVRDKKHSRSRLAKLINPDSNPGFIFSYTVIVGLMLAIFASALLYSLGVLSGYQLGNANTFNTAVSMIPVNASVMAETIFTPHLFAVKNLELLNFPSSGAITPEEDRADAIYWFNPDYIIYANNFSDYLSITYGSTQKIVSAVRNYTGDNYTTLYNESGVIVLKRSQ